MNRRDAALIAHLDAIETRVMARLDSIDARLGRMSEQIAGLMVDHATHRHDDE